MMKKIIRACTVSQSVGFVEGMLPDLMKKYEVVLLSSPGDELLKAEQRYGVHTIAVAMERHISPIKDLKALIVLIKLFHKEKPNMVHSMTPKAGLLCMMAACLARVPVRVHTFTGLVFPTSTGLKKRILMATDWLTCACATHIIPEGEGVKNDLINNGITKKPLKVLGYGNVRGIDMEKFSRRPEVMKKVAALKNSHIFEGKLIKDTSSYFTFLFVGRIVRDKGINELVEAFRRIHENNPQTKLILVGRNEDTLDPVSDKTRKEIKDNVDIEAVGQQSGDDLLAYYAASDCFVMPSYREGFPNTVLEAGAMGLPSIVTDINGSREIIVEGENGVIVPSKDESSLYTAMWKMLNDSEDRETMASKARKMIGDRFEQSFVRKCLYEFYDTIL